MTLYSWGNPRYFPGLPPPSRRYFDVDADSRVAADCHWQPRAWEHPTLIALHGLNGSSDAHYMRGLAAKAFARGLNVVRLNQRNCGDTERSVDRAVSFRADGRRRARRPRTERSRRPAGDRGGRLFARREPRAQTGGRVRGARAARRSVAVAAVSPIIEIGECVRALERPGQRALPMELRQGSEAPDAQERAPPSRAVRSRAARGRPDRARIRRGVHRAVLRVPQRRGLLPSRQRAAHHRSHRGAGARSSPPRTIRSSRRSRSTIRSSRAIHTSISASASTADIAASSVPSSGS